MSTVNLEEEQQVHKLLAELTHGPVALSSAPEVEARSARLLPVLRREVAQIPVRTSRSKLRRRRATWAVAAAAIVITGVGTGRWLTTPTTNAAELLVVQPRGSVVEIVDRGQHRFVTTAMSIEASGRLETSESAALTTAEGVLVELSAHTRVGLDELNPNAGWRLQLRQGQVACEVPKLTGPKTFSVVTNDAEVIVHGTRFTVTSNETSTCVRVTEGRVEVRSKGTQAFLNPGQAWGCDQPAAADTKAPIKQAIAPVNGNKLEGGERRLPMRSEGKPSVAEAQSAGSTLARETELVSRALTAERRGDNAASHALYAQFLERYPNSPMAPEARRGLQRVAKALEPTSN